MLTKRSVIIGLAGLNLFLLAAILFGTYSLPAAHAQRIGAGGNYIAVTCEADEDYDVFYLLDLPNRNLHAFVPTRKLDGTVQWAGMRDLQRDFRGGK